MYLLIDDIRALDVDVTCRTPEEGLERLRQGGITHLVLDNDMATKMEGRDVLRMAFQEDIVPKNVFLVTSNPIAKRAMEDDLRDNGYVMGSHGWWRAR